MNRLALVAGALAAAHAIIAIALTIVPNAEGWAGGILYAAWFALPALLLALALRSVRRTLHFVAGWSALLLAVGYLAVVVGNWSGYSPPQAGFAIAVSVPTVFVDLLIFWAVIVRRLPKESSRPRTT